jgi:nitrous oxide reductase accessory protein NosL
MKKLLIAFIGLTVFLSACEKEDTTIALPCFLQL